jgi:hypothetical protein
VVEAARRIRRRPNNTGRRVKAQVERRTAADSPDESLGSDNPLRRTRT